MLKDSQYYIVAALPGLIIKDLFAARKLQAVVKEVNDLYHENHEDTRILLIDDSLPHDSPDVEVK